MKKPITYLICTGLIMLLCGCNCSKTTNHIPPVKNFDLSRYLGKWYEIARLPNNFEKNITNAYAEYTMLPDGKVQVVNSGIRNRQITSVTGQAYLAKASDVGLLKVSFFYPFYATYKIIYLNRDYTTAIVTGDSMNYLWILARSETISPEELALLLNLLREWGFEPNLLQYPYGILNLAPHNRVL